MIRNTHAAQPAGHGRAPTRTTPRSWKAPRSQRFYPDAGRTSTRAHDEPTHILMKVETHNHPTAISPFPGAATGAGGEIRDEGATGRGAQAQGGPGRLHRLEPAHPRRSSSRGKRALRQARAHRLGARHHDRGPDRRRGVQQRVRPARTSAATSAPSSSRWRRRAARLSQADHARRRPRQHRARAHAEARRCRRARCSSSSAARRMLIGLGGGAASSMATGANAADLDFASVQRGNAEMERRAQEVIDRCWQLGDANPILSIHDVGAGGLSNALPELVHGGGAARAFDLRAHPDEEPRHVAAARSGATRRRSATCSRSRRETSPRSQRLCERERCPFAVVGAATRRRPAGRSTIRTSATRPVDMPLDVLLGKPPQMQRDVTQRAARAAAPLDARRHRRSPRPRDRVLRLPTVADKTFLDHHRRPHRRRPVRARPDGRARGRCRSPTAP